MAHKKPKAPTSRSGATAKRVNGERPKNVSKSRETREALLGERDRLRAEIASLREDRERYRRQLQAILTRSADRRDFDMSYEQLMATVDKGQSLENFVAELEGAGAHHG